MSHLDEPPITSIIIPVFNDPEGLETTVESLLDQTVDNYEIIIADNGSTDRTIDLAKEYSEKEQIELVVENEIQSSYAARNAGIDASSGAILAFIDADMWVESDYVENITNSMIKNDYSYMGCDVKVVSTGNSISRYNVATGFRIEKNIDKNNFAPTCCLVIHRRLIEEVGEFDQYLISSGDVEFGQRVVSAGHQLYFNSTINMYHPARSTIREFVSKYYRIGRGKIQLTRRHPERFSERWVFDPRNFLPNSPIIFYRSVRGKPKYVFEHPYWYFLAYINKLAKTAGKIQEKRKYQLSPNEPQDCNVL